MDGPTARMLASLVRAIAILAMPAPHQVAWLASLGVPGCVDELALEFDQGYQLVPQFIERQWLHVTVAGPLQALNDLLESMSGPENSSLWDVAAPESSTRWSDVRDQARNALLFLT